MFRHVVMFRWKPDTPPASIDEITEQLQGLPAIIPQIRAYRLGPDAGINEGNFDFVVVADFDSRDNYVTYRDDDRHREIIRTLIAPRVAERAAVQYAC